MCKIFLISIILTASLSLSSSTNNCNCEEEKYSYELQLNENDPDVIKFANDGWNKLVSEGRTRGAKSRSDLLVFCARVQIINNERRYTILVKYYTDWPDALLYCTIFVWTNQKKPLSISCYKGLFHDNHDPSELEQRNMYYFFHDNDEFCPRKYR